MPLPEDLAGGKRNVQEENDAGLPLLRNPLLLVAEHLPQQHQVVVVDPHYAVAVLFFPGKKKEKKEEKKRKENEKKTNERTNKHEMKQE